MVVGPAEKFLTPSPTSAPKILLAALTLPFYSRSLQRSVSGAENGAER